MNKSERETLRENIVTTFREEFSKRIKTILESQEAVTIQQNLRRDDLFFKGLIKAAQFQKELDNLTDSLKNTDEFRQLRYVNTQNYGEISEEYLKRKTLQVLNVKKDHHELDWQQIDFAIMRLWKKDSDVVEVRDKIVAEFIDECF